LIAGLLLELYHNTADKQYTEYTITINTLAELMRGNNNAPM